MNTLSKEEIFDAYERVFNEKVVEQSWSRFQRKYLDPESKALLQQWKDGLVNNPDGDMTIYDSVGYHKELVISYLFASKFSIAGALQYLNSQNVDYTKFAVFEDFPGMGLTTLDLIKRGVTDITVRQANEQQTEFMHTVLNDKVNLIDNFDHLPKDSQFDLVFSLETLEHYRDFMPYLRDITALVKPGGYFVLAKCFSAKTMYTGHFNSYLNEGKELTHYQTSKMIREYLRNSGFELLYTGYNAKPLVYRLKERE